MKHDIEKIIAVDGNSLLYRAYFAIGNNMTSRNGEPTGALHGFLMMMINLLERDPDYVFIAFDVHQPTFRHNRYAAYKAGRPETPGELVRQFETVRKVLKAMHIHVLECPGYEADDILGTIARIGSESGKETLIVTGDRDALQLTSEKTHILLTKKGLSETIEYDPDVLMDRYGLLPERMKDLKALMGDSSDNIPGVPGIGEKTALKLLSEFGTLEEVLNRSAEIKGKLGEKIRDNIDSARLSYWLGTICTQAPVDIDWTGSRWDPVGIRDAIPVLKELDLRSVISKLPSEPCSIAASDDLKIDISRRLILDVDELISFISMKSEAVDFSLCFTNGLSFSFDNSSDNVLSSGDTLFDTGVSEEDLFTALQAFFEDPAKHLICFDAKALMHRLFRYGIHLRCSFDDLMLADYLLDSLRPVKDIAELFDRYLPDTNVSSSGLFTICDHLKAEMNTSDVFQLYDRMELPLSKVLYGMEHEGVHINKEALVDLGKEFSDAADHLSQRIYQLAGEEFNILSPKQLGIVLFEKLGLHHGKKTKSGYATDADTLQKLRLDSEIIDQILEYRALTKLKGTYTDGLSELLSKSDGRIHTSFNQCLTATGRLSSSEPNLQNIPVRTDLGREIRKAFTAKPGYVLIDGDYSQIELRLLAHISGDEVMIHSFISGEDIHARTAGEVFHVPIEEVTSEMRSAAKAVNFGIVYGISVYGLSENLGIPVPVAKDYIERYLQRYPAIDRYMHESVKKAAACGYAATLYGRKRALPELMNTNYNIRSFGERVAMNMPIQGTAADVIKFAMIRVNDMLTDRKLDAKLVLQVHDELILEASEKDAAVAAAALKEAMEEVDTFSVPLTVEIKMGHSWYETK